MSQPTTVRPTAVSLINLYCQKVQRSGPIKMPQYETLQKEGSDHRPTFQVSCSFQDTVQLGEGSTLKLAKEEAAKGVVKALDIETKFAELEHATSFSIDSYNAPLGEIWESAEGKEYTLVLKKKVGKNSQYRKFVVKISEEVV